MKKEPVRKVPCCSVCGEPAVIRQRESGRHLCGAHLAADIEGRVAATIASERQVAPGDCIAVALSGGKDSTALLLLLHSLFSSRDDIRLVAVTVDEGIHGYRDETLRSAEELVKRLGVEHVTVSFPDLFGETLDTVLQGREEQACSICGILRKKALVTAAERAGATKLATGHNLDDEAQSVLMNLLRGDLMRLVRNSGADSGGRFIPRIKPLMYIHEKEIAAYLMVQGTWSDLPECPYAVHALRREVRSMLAQIEYAHPGTMLRLMENKKKVETAFAGKPAREPLGSCRQCGDPCSRDLCQFCQLKTTLWG
ncbi:MULTISPECIES: TIGR00269 family protein [unclassified Methanoregula]|uniref:TIGR00269 family protein n=1 Tax=unclassified Methanoregula TaxID=2649730 RepID=UPI0009D1BB7B|nr:MULTISPECIES: TIGR00269 family protein [unclassified Methanoregula]OPX62636.1 MAG: tRNA 2-thiocytidine biosynthesis protein TtcA [Methanoregula sp. PtaB.Bin085]OPY33011.1 MAG: tRNA 2-thiocytidine biosynthesis protein TtcA [Methanoregula sp. PtaU1.Bin006]